ncbi:chromosome partitioning protein ParB [Porphyromonadaceae bacterium COT-184 OH4590]|nr:chromosome partitioning protein ParB [Porphyromonadaceae bacterium COT-184 OH4590]MDO4726623.1 ParB/RepB/Spo0J family partition protein [Porphyromonadaceae bacterium]
MKKQVLGRGLNALISTEEVKTDGSSIINEIDIDFIEANPNQPRTDFDEEALAELSDSIKENGLISPITLRKIDDSRYQIIAGERRYRASKMAGLTKIPAYIRTADDEQMHIMALIENIQRADLNAIEIALGYQKAMNDFDLTQEKLSERLGKKRTTIANFLRLLKLPAEIQLGLKDRKVDMGHARAIAGLSEPTNQIKVYEAVVKNGLSVRATEAMVKQIALNNGNISGKEKPQKFVSEEYDNLKKELSQLFNTKVNLQYNEQGKGKISLSFDSDDDLMRIMSILDKLKTD